MYQVQKMNNKRYGVFASICKDMPIAQFDNAEMAHDFAQQKNQHLNHIVNARIPKLPAQIIRKVNKHLSK